MADDPNVSSLDTRGAILSGDLRKTVFLLALPVLGEQFLSFCIGFYDTWLSGRLGAEATTAVGLAVYVNWLAIMLFALVGTGTTALVARHWGAGRFTDANEVTNRSISLALIVGAVVSVLIMAAAPGFASLLDMHGETGRIAVRYLRIDALGMCFTSLSLVGAAALRGTGDMRTPMLILGLTSIVNAVASTLFVFGIGPLPRLGLDVALLQPMGVDGIVAGTLFARATGGLLMLLVLSRGWSELRLSAAQMKPRGETSRRILRIGAPAALDGAVMWFGQLLFLMIIARLEHGPLGDATFAAHVVGIRVEAITYLPAVAWGFAAATMIGQLLGAGDPRRATRAGHSAALQCGLLALIASFAFYFGAGFIYELMHNDPSVHRIGTPALQLLAIFQIPSVMVIVYVTALRGAGDTRFPLWMTVIGVFGVRLPLAYWCGIHQGGGLWGAWIGMCADTSVRAVMGVVRFHGGRWASTRV